MDIVLIVVIIVLLLEELKNGTAPSHSTDYKYHEYIMNIS